MILQKILGIVSSANALPKFQKFSGDKWEQEAER